MHVSEVTLSFLNNEFEVEPAHGERREEMLRQAGIKTYFIVKVLKPVSSLSIHTHFIMSTVILLTPTIFMVNNDVLTIAMNRRYNNIWGFGYTVYVFFVTFQ